MNGEIDVETAQAAAQSIAANNFDPTRIITNHTEPIVNAIKQYLNVPFLMKLTGTVIMLLILFIIYRICRSMILRLPENKLKAQHSMMVQKTLKYIYYVCAAMYVLGLFGIKFSAIWGAAGVAGVAIGFAAQTSVSNIISGLFVLSENAMKIGDLVTIDGVTGVVDSTDLLSVKIHTLDNQLVRVPNSTIINKNFLNTSYFPQRRMTIGVSVSYDTDMTLALETLKKAPALCPTVLREPEPAAWFDKFGEKGIDLVLAVWFKSEDFLQTKNSAFIAIKKVYDEAGIEIPYYKLNVKMLSGGTE